jgi:hypothetical protein
MFLEGGGVKRGRLVRLTTPNCGLSRKYEILDDSQHLGLYDL